MDQPDEINFSFYCAHVIRDARLVLEFHSADEDAVDASIRVTIVQQSITRRRQHMPGLDALLDEAADILTQLSQAELGLQLSLQRNAVAAQLKPLEITMERLQFLRQEGYTVVEIAAKFNVTRQTIHNKINLYNLKQQFAFANITDDDLDQHVQDCVEDSPGAGYRIVLGYLSGIGLRIQRSRVRNSLIRIDPEGTGKRLSAFVPRRVYSVKAPRSLFHMDGNHKLRRAGFVIHGCVDGFTRMVIFLRCNTNNRAATVLQDFIQGCEEFGLPSRVRSDYGGENVDVAKYMLEERGTGRGTFLTGASVHNQRIERLWRDVNRLATKKFRVLFCAMERGNIVDHDNRIHRMALHFVFRPRLQRSLDEFSIYWNHHKITTEHNRSPRQLFIDAAFSASGLAGSDPETVVEDYGAEDNDRDEDSEGPVVDAVELDDVLGEQPGILGLMQRDLDPLREDNEDGVNCFTEAVAYLEALYLEDPWF